MKKNAAHSPHHHELLQGNSSPSPAGGAFSMYICGIRIPQEKRDKGVICRVKTQSQK